MDKLIHGQEANLTTKRMFTYHGDDDEVAQMIFEKKYWNEDRRVSQYLASRKAGENIWLENR